MGTSDPGFVSRVGLALVAPRRGLHVAIAPEVSGRAGSDLLRVFAALIVAAETRALVSAGWLGALDGVAVGGQALLSTLSKTLTTPMVIVVAAALVLWLGAGRRRNLGRAFDAACVAVVPLMVLQLAVAAVASVLAIDLRAMQLATWLGIGWSGALVGLFLIESRRRATAPEGPPARGGRAAGVAVVVVAAATLAVNGVSIVRDLDAVRPVSTGDLAPDVALVQRLPAPEARLSVSGLRGRVVVLDFWATWCGPCLSALPRLDALAKRHAAEPLSVVAINLDDLAAAETIWRQRGYSMVLAHGHDAAARYRVGPIPHTVVIDRDGFIRSVHLGGGTAKTVEAVERLLANQ